MFLPSSKYIVDSESVAVAAVGYRQDLTPLYCKADLIIGARKMRHLSLRWQLLGVFLS